MSKSIHLLGLNGIRAIAAIAVVCSHTNQGLGNFNLTPLPTLDLAGHGVTMFFALSGFLITYLLLHERSKQEIDIKKFYIRRILRIWPLYFLYLIIYLIIAFSTGLIDIDSFDIILLYTFFMANVPLIMGNALLYIGHFWSISVEEQFYLFWPWLIKKAKGNLFFYLFSFTSIYFIFRLLFRFLEYKFGISLPYLAIQVNRFDCMAIGGIGAYLFYHNNNAFKKIAFHPITQTIAWIVIFLLLFNRFHIASIIDPEIVSVITVIIILNVAANPNRIISLDNPIFDFLGKISYGIYVIHPLVIFAYPSLLNNFNIDPQFKHIWVYSGILFFTIILSYLSFEYYEKRFILIKDRFSVVKSSGSKTIISKPIAR